MTEEHETVAIARKLRYDLTAMQAKVTDLLNALGRLDLPEGRPVCSVAGCGFRPGMNMPSLAEHLYTVHGGPLPAHWQSDESEAA